MGQGGDAGQGVAHEREARHSPRAPREGPHIDRVQLVQGEFGGGGQDAVIVFGALLCVVRVREGGRVCAS